jgi:hypothetical protein
LDGGPNRERNYFRYYNTIRNGYEVLRFQDREVYVLAKNGQWLLSQQSNESLSNFSLTDSAARIDPNDETIPSYPPIRSGLGSTQQLIRFVRSLNLERNDQVVIYWSGHGEEPTNRERPPTSGYSFWGRTETWDEIRRQFARLKNSPSFVHIVESSFGGGAHILAQNLEGHCVASVVPYFTTGNSGNHFQSPFSKNLWEYILKNPDELNLARASLAAFAKDSANRHLGAISSFDYLDHVEGFGPYDRPRSGLLFKRRFDPETKTFKYWQSRPRDFQSAILEESILFSPYLELFADQKKLCGDEILDTDIYRSDDMLQFLEDLLRSDIRKRLEEASLESPESRNLFEWALFKLNARPQEYSGAIDRLRSDELVEGDKFLLHEYALVHRSLTVIEQLSQLEGIGSAKRKEKLRALLECEWRSW